MARPSILAAATIWLVSLGSAASAQSTAATAGAVQIEDSIVVQSSGTVIFQDIEITPQTTIPVTTVASSAVTNVTVVGAGGDAVSLSVPQTINAISEENGRSVTVVTNTRGQYAAIQDFQTLLSTGGILSVDVGGAIQISANELLPGEYRGLLVVVAQYN